MLSNVFLYCHLPVSFSSGCKWGLGFRWVTLSQGVTDGACGLGGCSSRCKQVRASDRCWHDSESSPGVGEANALGVMVAMGDEWMGVWGGCSQVSGTSMGGGRTQDIPSGIRTLVGSSSQGPRLLSMSIQGQGSVGCRCHWGCRVGRLLTSLWCFTGWRCSTRCAYGV